MSPAFLMLPGPPAPPFGWKGRVWHGYTLAKERLGGLFAQTTIVDRDVEVTLDGKKRRLRWVLVQEKVAVEAIKAFGQRSYEVLLGMLRRGVRDPPVLRDAIREAQLAALRGGPIVP